MNTIKKLFTVDETANNTTWYYGMKLTTKSGNTITLDPDTGIFLNGSPILNGGGNSGPITVDEILISNLDRKIEINTASGIVFSTLSTLNAFGDFGARLDPTSTLQIGNATLSMDLLSSLQNTLNPTTGSITLPEASSLSIGDQTITRNSILHVNTSLTSLGTRISLAEGTLNTLPTTISQQGTAISEIDSRVTSVEDLSSINSGKISTLQSGLNTTNSNLSFLDTKVTSLSTTVESIDNMIDNIIYEVNDANSNSVSAKNTAESAITSSQIAVTTANTALTTANDAVTTANSAYNSSRDALIEATNAGLDAYNAVTTANTALGTANVAESNVNVAISTANLAMDKAGVAHNVAEVATNIANTALASTAPIPGIQTSISDLQHEDTVLNARIQALEYISGSTDPIVLPYYIKDTNIDFGVGKVKVTPNEVVINTDTLTSQKLKTLNALSTATEQVVTNQRVYLYTPGDTGDPGFFGYSSTPFTTIANPTWVKETSANFGTTVLTEGSLAFGSGVFNESNLKTLSDIHNAGAESFTTGASFLSPKTSGFAKVPLPDYLTGTGLNFPGAFFGNNQAAVVSELENIDEGDADSVVVFDSTERSFRYKAKPAWINETQPSIGNLGGTGGENEAYLFKDGLTFGNSTGVTSDEYTTVTSDGIKVIDRTSGSIGQRNYFHYSKNGITLGNQLETPVVLDKPKLASLEKIATAPETVFNTNHYTLVKDKVSGTFSYVKALPSYSYLSNNTITMGSITGSSIINATTFTFLDVPTVNFSSTGMNVGDYSVSPNNGFSTGQIALKTTGLKVGSNTLDFNDLTSLKLNFVGAQDTAVFPSGDFSMLTKTTSGNKWLKAPASLKWLGESSIASPGFSISPTTLNYTSGVNSSTSNASGFNSTSSTGNFTLDASGITSISTVNPLFTGTKKISHVGVNMINSLESNLYEITQGVTIPFNYALTSSYNADTGFTVGFSKPSELTQNSIYQPKTNPYAVMSSELALDGVNPKQAILDASGLSFPSSGTTIPQNSTRALHDETTYNSNFARIGKPTVGNSAIMSKLALHFMEDAISKSEFNLNGLRIGPTNNIYTMLRNNGLDFKDTTTSTLNKASVDAANRLRDATLDTAPTGKKMMLIDESTKAITWKNQPYYLQDNKIRMEKNNKFLEINDTNCDLKSGSSDGVSYVNINGSQGTINLKTGTGTTDKILTAVDVEVTNKFKPMMTTSNYNPTTANRTTSMYLTYEPVNKTFSWEKKYKLTIDAETQLCKLSNPVTNPYESPDSRSSSNRSTTVETYLWFETLILTVTNFSYNQWYMIGLGGSSSTDVLTMEKTSLSSNRNYDGTLLFIPANKFVFGPDYNGKYYFKVLSHGATYTTKETYTFLIKRHTKDTSGLETMQYGF